MDEDDEDEDSWDDAMDDLEDPWMANPVAEPSALEEAVFAAPSTTPMPAPYSDTTAIVPVSFAEVAQRLGSPHAALGAASTSDGGRSSGSGGSSSITGVSPLGRTALLILDVRSAVEFAAGHLPGAVSCPVAELSAASLSALLAAAAATFSTKGPAAASSPAVVAAAVEVLVVGSGDFRSAQACVRLTRVLRVPTVMHYEGGTADWVLRRGTAA